MLGGCTFWRWWFQWQLFLVMTNANTFSTSPTSISVTAIVASPLGQNLTKRPLGKLLFQIVQSECLNKTRLLRWHNLLTFQVRDLGMWFLSNGRIPDLGTDPETSFPPMREQNHNFYTIFTHFSHWWLVLWHFVLPLREQPHIKKKQKQIHIFYTGDFSWGILSPWNGILFQFYE